MHGILLSLFALPIAVSVAMALLYEASLLVARIALAKRIKKQEQDAIEDIDKDDD